MWTIILLVFLTFVIYRHFKKSLIYWKEQNVQHDRPFPIFGNMLPILLGKISNVEMIQKLYNKYSSGRYVGLYNFGATSLVLRDPELIKKITVKEFETFPEHRPFIPSDVDPLWSNNLFAMEGGEKWHQLRSTLSPSFTSSKMKAMFVLMKECTKEFINYFESKGDSVDVELKDSFARFGNDVIATTAFGVTCNSLSDPKNEFYVLGKELMNFKGLRRIIFMLNLICPTMARITRVSFFPEKIRKFFGSLIKETLQLRREKKVVRPDMIHLLMEYQKENPTQEEDAHSTPEAGFAVVEESVFGKTKQKLKLEVTDDIITSQVMIFFFAGLDTVSTMMSYTIYELALNPDIQSRLRAEIEDALRSSDGKLTYDNLMRMKYLDMVISGPTETPVFLQKHSHVICPIFAIHRDPKYYHNPDKFDPERFNDENRSSIHPYTYLPFGAGPRNCIGSRFALLEGKLIIAEIVRNFEIVPVRKTQVPIVFSTTNFNPLPDNGIWVGFRRRKEDEI
ncbi:hypothetical protein PPYR_13545 [Photinus pyralis]|uniref:Cytochrome P450 n=1 Tax=Photinus pyralis TaxID=7054 RepID=A0A5N4A9C6_PHOPY|nr:hypothetical protein PPYR_13545 [Photinus pyralis]